MEREAGIAIEHDRVHRDGSRGARCRHRQR
jgi:hypothetical protein